MKKTQLISEEVKKLQKIAGLIKENVNEGPGAQKSGLAKLVMKTGTFDREFMDYLRDNNITFKILQWNGRGTSGTNPEVEYYGDRAALEAMIDGPFDSGDAEQNQDYKDQIEQA